MVKVIAATGTDGRWFLQNTEDNSYLGGQDAGLYSNSQNYDLAIEAASKASVTVSCKAGKYGTVIFPFTPDVSTGFDDITFYSCDAKNPETSNVQLTEVPTPAANVPYIIKNDSGVDFSTDLEGWGAASTTSYTAGWLNGVLAATVVPENSYVLQTQSGVQAFYKVTVDDFEVPAYKCYLDASAGEAKALFLDLGDADAISDVRGKMEDGRNEIFNLAGQRVNKAQKGLYIINGKKVLVK